MRPGLSTPSLGITKLRTGDESLANENSTFNSLSRDHIMSTSLSAGLLDSKTFNSLSRDHCQYLQTKRYNCYAHLSTPSLGITCDIDVRKGNLVLYSTFNSLSRDHAIRMAVRDLIRREGLSTPSLGITEPDSGIFRLSAAFCRGTSSHK